MQKDQGSASTGQLEASWLVAKPLRSNASVYNKASERMSLRPPSVLRATVHSSGQHSALGGSEAPPGPCTPGEGPHGTYHPYNLQASGSICFSPQRINSGRVTSFSCLVHHASSDNGLARCSVNTRLKRHFCGFAQERHRSMVAVVMRPSGTQARREELRSRAAARERP